MMLELCSSKHMAEAVRSTCFRPESSPVFLRDKTPNSRDTKFYSALFQEFVRRGIFSEELEAAFHEDSARWRTMTTDIQVAVRGLAREFGISSSVFGGIGGFSALLP